MRKTTILGLLCMLIFAGLCLAEEATGTWKGSSNEGDWVFKLKSEAGKVTGNTYSMEGKELPIKDGKLEGNNISFAFDTEWQGQPIGLVCKGTVKGDSMALHVETDNGAWGTDLDLKRSDK
ncbi:MAG TPA: hypothetical protein VKW78_08100 [Terriglobales bacterium]|nr:hypothetical protein [Terriglobales bacterium]